MNGKFSIRRGVFETNSSTTHTMQIVNKDFSRKVVIDAIAERIEKNIEEDEKYNRYSHVEEFIREKDGKRLFVLEGLEISVDMDNANYTTAKISTDIGKIQYLFSDFVSSLTNTLEWGGMYSWDVKPHCVEKSKYYKNFHDTLMEYFKMHKDVFGIIDDIVIECPTGDVPTYYFDNDSYNVFSESDVADLDKTKGKFHNIMSCGNDIIYRVFDYHDANYIYVHVY